VSKPSRRSLPWFKELQGTLDELSKVLQKQLFYMKHVWIVLKQMVVMPKEQRLLNGVTKLPPVLSAGQIQELHLVEVVEDSMGAAEAFLDRFGHQLKWCEGALYLRTGNLWEDVTGDQSRLFDMVSCVSYAKVHVGKGGEEALNVFNREPCGVESILKFIQAQARRKCDAPGFKELVESSTEGRLCFRDGVLDIHSKEFTKWGVELRHRVHPMLMINTDYNPDVPDDDVEFLYNTVFLKPFLPPRAQAGEDAHAEAVEQATYLLSLFARALAGHGDKRFNSLVGKPNSGKGVINAMVTQSFGCYVRTQSINVFQKKSTISGDVRDLQWLAGCQGKRLIFVNEGSKEEGDTDAGVATKVIDGELLKNLSGGGDEFQYRRNYAKSEEKIAPKFLINFMTNNVLVRLDSRLSTPTLCYAPLGLVKYNYRTWQNLKCNEAWESRGAVFEFKCSFANHLDSADATAREAIADIKKDICGEQR
jgi:hypothetical protein